ncbi:hypothetical protein D7B24_008270 [Verticillium nonalfalfae]|uniref:Uncharacterized protein n=1 Tax=Verticillium nonalfalfae TaxID=1051616 RepID=A0A3M9Y639_9PEZI|nr:uncharacterized protein D7B24_008270 [Verticillium nonalfalfae]RNJ55741.1 hypothetical protein D7B24_008270 [Verticillium nonalfalfae]
MFRSPFGGPGHHGSFRHDPHTCHRFENGRPAVNVNNYSYPPDHDAGRLLALSNQHACDPNSSQFPSHLVSAHAARRLSYPHLQTRCTVILPSGERALVDRHHLVTLLPRTRNAPSAGRGAVFDLSAFLADYTPNLDDIPAALFVPGFHAALTFVMRHVEALSLRTAAAAASTPPSPLFARQRALLANVPPRDEPPLVFDLFQHALFACCALDQDRALGCCDALGLEVVTWLLDLLPRVQRYGTREAVVYLFVGLARVFRATTTTTTGGGGGAQVAVLGRFWNALEPDERAVAGAIVGDGAGGAGRGGNAARVLQALRGLRNAGVVE